jgi:hypothetical protein
MKLQMRPSNVARRILTSSSHRFKRSMQGFEIVGRVLLHHDVLQTHARDPSLHEHGSEQLPTPAAKGKNSCQRYISRRTDPFSANPRITCFFSSLVYATETMLTLLTPSRPSCISKISNVRVPNCRNGSAFGLIWPPTLRGNILSPIIAQSPCLSCRARNKIGLCSPNE